MSAQMPDGGGILGVKMDEKHVILNFPRAITWLKLDPATANEVAEEMARCAYHAIHGVPSPDKNKSLIKEQVYQKLVNRGAIVLRQLTEKGKPFDYQSRFLLDIILSELAGQ